MNQILPAKAIGIGGIFKDNEITIEFKLPENQSLAVLAYEGNVAAHNAVKIQKYVSRDAPFYYCKIKSLGYVISHKDFKFLEEEVKS